MNATLIVPDPLAEQEVSIVITLGLNDNRKLAADDMASGRLPRDERPTLVSIGVAGQRPIIKSGVFGTAMALIEEAWTAFGVQAQLAEPTAAAAVPDAEEIVAETAVLSGSTEPNAAVTGVDAADLSTQHTASTPAAPHPTASNLSLF